MCKLGSIRLYSTVHLEHQPSHRSVPESIVAGVFFFITVTIRKWRPYSSGLILFLTTHLHLFYIMCSGRLLVLTGEKPRTILTAVYPKPQKNTFVFDAHSVCWRENGLKWRPRFLCGKNGLRALVCMQSCYTCWWLKGTNLDVLDLRPICKLIFRSYSEDCMRIVQHCSSAEEWATVLQFHAMVRLLPNLNHYPVSHTQKLRGRSSTEKISQAMAFIHIIAYCSISEEKFT